MFTGKTYFMHILLSFECHITTHCIFLIVAHNAHAKIKGLVSLQSTFTNKSKKDFCPSSACALLAFKHTHTISIAVTISLNSTGCKRGFSGQNLISTSIRSDTVLDLDCGANPLMEAPQNGGTYLARLLLFTFYMDRKITPLCMFTGCIGVSHTPFKTTTVIPVYI